MLHIYHQKSTGIVGKEYIQDTPRKQLHSNRFQQLAIGDTFTLGITKQGKLFGWGQDFLGKGVEQKEPFPIPFETEAVVASCGSKHMAVIDKQGTAFTWGENGSFFSGGGQLGHGSIGAHVGAPTAVDAFGSLRAKIIAVSCGHAHTVFLTDEGEVWACGVGEYGVLGTGNSANSTVPVVLECLENEQITRIACGYDHSLVLNVEGRIFSWGRNNAGQLGHSDSFIDIYSMEEFPRLVEDLPEVVEIAAGHGRSAAISEDGELYVWGSRLNHAPKHISRELFNGLKVAKVAIGGSHDHSVIAVLTEDGGLWTFGDGSSHMLGSGQRSGFLGKQPLPAMVESLKSRSVLQLFTGLGQHMAVLVEHNNERK